MTQSDTNDSESLDKGRQIAEGIFGSEYSKCLSRRGIRELQERNSEWEFTEGDIIREVLEHHAPGGIPLGKSEYRIKWCLRRVSDGKRCYYVEKPEGGNHLYTAKAVEPSYEQIPLKESNEWYVDSGGDSP